MPSTNGPAGGTDAPTDDNFDRFARRVGIDLTRPAPSDGVANLERRRARQVRNRNAALGSVIVLVLGGSIFGLANRNRPGIVATTPTTQAVAPSSVETTTSTAAATTTPALVVEPAVTTTAAMSVTSAPTTALTTSTTAAVVPSSAGPVVRDPQFWNVLPSSGLSTRVQPLVAALGEQVAVIGGSPGYDQELNDGKYQLTDGKILNAAGTAWISMATSPEKLGAMNSAVWTGSTLLVVTSTGSLLGYTLSTNRWTTLARSPLPAQVLAIAAWTGTEMLLIGAVDPGTRGDSMPMKGAAYKPSTNTWRAIATPPAGVFGWRTNSFAAGHLWVSGSAKDRTGYSWYDPTTNVWSAAPVPTPTSWIVSVGNGQVIAAESASNVQGILSRYEPGSGEWVPAGELHHNETNGFGSVFVAGNRLIADTGSGGTNGRFLAVREEAGTWMSISSPVTTNEDVLIVMPSGRLIGTNGSEASELRFTDRTVGVRSCSKADFAPSVTAGSFGEAGHIVLTNISTTACVVHGAPPLLPMLRIDGQWVSPTPLDDSSLPASMAGSPQNGGGRIEPGKAATVDLWSSRMPGVDNGKTPTCPYSTPDAVRFEIWRGDTITVEIPLPKGCWHIGPVTSWTPSS